MLNLSKSIKTIYYLHKNRFSTIPYQNFNTNKLELSDMKEGMTENLQENLINIYKQFIDAISKKDESFINTNCQKQFSKRIIENFKNQGELLVNKEKLVDIELMNYEFHFNIHSDRVRNKKQNVTLRKVRSN
jgi:hypothetical protein